MTLKEKLAQAQANVPKVYDAGVFDSGFAVGYTEGVDKGQSLFGIQNEVKGTKIVTLDYVNENEHEFEVKLSSDTVTDFSGVEVDVYSGNFFDINSLTGFTVEGNTIVKSKNKTAYILPQEKALPNTQYYISYETDILYDGSPMKEFNIYVTYTDNTYEEYYVSRRPHGFATNANKSVKHIRLRTMDYNDAQKMSNLQIEIGAHNTGYMVYFCTK